MTDPCLHLRVKFDVAAATSSCLDCGASIGDRSALRTSHYADDLRAAAQALRRVLQLDEDGRPVVPHDAYERFMLDLDWPVAVSHLLDRVATLYPSMGHMAAQAAETILKAARAQGITP